MPTVSGGIHPTQKPVELCEYLIRTYTRPGELVADICAGSGTTAIAAINTERRFVCFETAPSFYAAASERIRAAQAVKSSGEKRSVIIQQYSIIYADPPWRYSAKKVQGAAENHYPL